MFRFCDVVEAEIKSHLFVILIFRQPSSVLRRISRMVLLIGLYFSNVVFLRGENRPLRLWRYRNSKTRSEEILNNAPLPIEIHCNFKCMSLSWLRLDFWQDFSCWAATQVQVADGLSRISAASLLWGTGSRVFVCRRKVKDEAFGEDHHSHWSWWKRMSTLRSLLSADCEGFQGTYQGWRCGKFVPSLCHSFGS